MNLDWLGIAGIAISAALGASSIVSLWRARRDQRSSTRFEDPVTPSELEGLNPWLSILRQLEIPDFEVLSILKSRHEQGVFGVRFVNSSEPRVLKVFVHTAGAATMLTAQREVFATYLLGDGPTCLHPSITRTRDRSATALIRDWIPGETLLDFIVHQGRLLTLAEADVLVRAVCSATDELHKLGIIHCDIKPSNIIGEWRRAFDGRPATVRLIDFGMFAPVDPEGAHRGPVAVEGTPNFTAPERLFFSTASPASDVYSCAVVTVFALTGRHQPASDDIPKALRDVLFRASSREASQRYSTINEFGAAWDSAFRPLAASKEVHQGALPLPTPDSLIEGAGRNTIPRSPIWSGSIAERARTSLDQDLLDFREQNAEIIRRLSSMVESRRGSRDSARFDELLKALEKKLADSASSQDGPPAISPKPEGIL